LQGFGKREHSTTSANGGTKARSEKGALYPIRNLRTPSVQLGARDLIRSFLLGLGMYPPRYNGGLNLTPQNERR